MAYFMTMTNFMTWFTCHKMYFRAFNSKASVDAVLCNHSHYLFIFQFHYLKVPLKPLGITTCCQDPHSPSNYELILLSYMCLFTKHHVSMAASLNTSTLSGIKLQPNAWMPHHVHPFTSWGIFRLFLFFATTDNTIVSIWVQFLCGYV